MTVNSIKRIRDKELGTIILRKHPLSRNYILKIKNGMVSVSLPRTGSFARAENLVRINRELLVKKLSEYKQKSIPPRSYDEKELRKKAESYIPKELEKLADKFGFAYDRIRINKSRTRWGSCSSKKSINISLYIMQLPSDLIDYVLLHELCHTLEMNHGPKFQFLLNKVTAGKSSILKKKLKTYTI